MMKITQPWFQNLKHHLFQSVFSGVIFVLTVVGLGALFVYAAFTHINDDQQLTYDEWQELVAHLFWKPSSAGGIIYTGNIEVGGGVKVGNITATCSASNEGILKYDSNDSCLSYCNGSNWSNVSCSVNGACGSAHETNRTEPPSTTTEKCTAGTASLVKYF